MKAFCRLCLIGPRNSNQTRPGQCARPGELHGSVGGARGDGRGRPRKLEGGDVSTPGEQAFGPKAPGRERRDGSAGARSLVSLKSAGCAMKPKVVCSNDNRDRETKAGGAASQRAVDPSICGRAGMCGHDGVLRLRDSEEIRDREAARRLTEHRTLFRALDRLAKLELVEEPLGGPGARSAGRPAAAAAVSRDGERELADGRMPDAAAAKASTRPGLAAPRPPGVAEMRWPVVKGAAGVAESQLAGPLPMMMVMVRVPGRAEGCPVGAGQRHSTGSGR